jgi:hypothetical protein
MSENVLALRIRFGPGTRRQSANDATQAMRGLMIGARLPMPAIATDDTGYNVVVSWSFDCKLDGHMRGEIGSLLLELMADIGADHWYGPPVGVAHPILHELDAFWQTLDQAVDRQRDDHVKFSAFVEPLALLSSRLCTVAEAAQQAGATPEQLTAALAHPPTAQAVDALVLTMNQSGTTCLRRAIARLECVVEDPASNVAEIVAASNALIRLRPHAITQVRPKPGAMVRHIATACRGSPETIVNFQFDTAPRLPTSPGGRPKT